MTEEIKEKDAMLALSELLPTMRKMQAEDNSILSIIARLEKRITAEPSPVIPYVKVSKKDLAFVLNELKKTISTDLFVVKGCTRGYTEPFDSDKSLKIRRIFALESEAESFKNTLDTHYVRHAFVEKHSLDFQVTVGGGVFVLLKLSHSDSDFEEVLGFYKSWEEAEHIGKTSDLTDDFYAVPERWEIN